jgi:hypothetical protein
VETVLQQGKQAIATLDEARAASASWLRAEVSGMGGLVCR